MITELKIGDKIKLEGYDEAWIGWVTNSSYQISKIKSRTDENGKISMGWLMKNLEVCWVTKWDWHSKNYTTDDVKQLIKHFVKTADFIDFNREYGITGWKELDKWLEQNVK